MIDFSCLSGRNDVYVALDCEPIPRRLVLRRIRYEYHRHFRHGVIKPKFVSPKRKVVTFSKYISTVASVAKNGRTDML